MRLSQITTLGVGGEIGEYVECKTTQKLIETVVTADLKKTPCLIIGGGSNIVGSEKGFPGIVAAVKTNGIIQKDNHFTVESGVILDDFIKQVSSKYSGMELLSGIPGTIGATPIQNVGAYGQEISQVTKSVTVFDRKIKEFVNINAEQCGFEYRSSIFKSSKRYIITSIDLILSEQPLENIRHQDLAKIKDNSPLNLRKSVIEIRRQKSMIYDISDPDSHSAGSFFVNPVVAQDLAAEISRQFGPMPTYPDKNGVKIPAAWLIEKAGFNKGYREGNVGISSKHALAIVNLGGATGDEVRHLMNKIQSSIFEKFSIMLLPEPLMLD